MHTEESIIRLSSDDIIELIRENRNDLITKLLKNDYLVEFLRNKHNLTNLSAVKIEFIKRSLKELMLTTVDLSHYGGLIIEIRRAGSMIISKNREDFFYRDIEKAIKNYLL